ncbi:MAG: MBL fold metallo-hydrolase [Calditrichia bacterium]
MNITLQSFGAAREVTGSKHMVTIDSEKILIDCGAFQGKRKESDEKNRKLKFYPHELNAVILTHAHYDHCGLLPVLTKNGFEDNIYATPATRDLANLIMMDSAKIQARDAEFLRKQALKRGEEFKWEPLYDEQDVIKTVNQFVTLSYHRPLYITPHVQINFYDAGHILGSSIAYLTLNKNGEDIRIAFTGDLGRPNKPIIKDPEPIPEVDYLVLESTYGNRLHDSIDDAMDLLADIINRTVKRGGKIIIPAFAVERTQELIFYLHLLNDQQKIPDIPVFVDSPMATNATSIFRVHPECYDQETYDAFLQHHKNPFGFNKLHYITNVAESKALNSIKESCIIISADGMCEAGRIQHHLLHNIENPANTILIVGYMAENTLGRKIKEGISPVKIYGQYYELKAEVAELNSFSAHADYMEIWNYLNRIPLGRLKKILLVHGEPDAQDHLKKFLEEKGLPPVEIMEYDKTIALNSST